MSYNSEDRSYGDPQRYLIYTPLRLISDPCGYSRRPNQAVPVPYRSNSEENIDPPMDFEDGRSDRVGYELLLHGSKERLNSQRLIVNQVHKPGTTD